MVRLQVDVLGQAVGIDQVQWSLAQDLIGDVGLAQRGIPGLGEGHVRSRLAAFGWPAMLANRRHASRFRTRPPKASLWGWYSAAREGGPACRCLQRATSS